MIVKTLPGTNLDEQAFQFVFFADAFVFSHPIVVAAKKLGSADSQDRESALEDLEKTFHQESSSVNELIASSSYLFV